MTDALDDLRFFIALVQVRGLSAAARMLDSSPAAMSRRLAALEARLGVRLVSRTTRTFELTEEGALFHERCVKIVAEIEEAEAEASAGGATPRGLLRIGVPMEIGRRRIAPIVADYVALYPEVQAHLMPLDGGLDIHGDHLDVSLRTGLPSEQDVVVAKIISTRLLVCAAPAYVAAHGRPSTPADLAGHRCIRQVLPRSNGEHWRLTRDGRAYEVRVRGALSTSSAEVVHDWVLAGHGVGLKARWDLTSDLAEGRLIPCMPEYLGEEITLSAVYASRKHLPPRVRLFIDFVKDRLTHYCASVQDAA